MLISLAANIYTKLSHVLFLWYFFFAISICDIYSIWLSVFLFSPSLNNAHANIIPRFQNAIVTYLVLEPGPRKFVYLRGSPGTTLNMEAASYPKR